MVLLLDDRLTAPLAAIFPWAIYVSCLVDKATVTSASLFMDLNQIETKTDSNFKRARKICSERCRPWRH